MREGTANAKITDIDAKCEALYTKNDVERMFSNALASFYNVFLDNYTEYACKAPEEGVNMGKFLIDRRVPINGSIQRIRANSEEEYANKLFSFMGGGVRETAATKQKHNFKEYAQQWFEVFSKPNIEQTTAVTYERQLRLYINPAFGHMDIEDIKPADVQELFNGMNGKRSTKEKCKEVLNMVFERAIEEDIILKNPLKSKTVRIKGKASTPTEPYTLEEMKYIVAHIPDIKNVTDKMFLALQSLHPLRLEEVLGLQWQDIDIANGLIRIRRAVTHPDRNQPVIKETKTTASARTIALVPKVVEWLEVGAPTHFVIGGEKPFSCQRVQNMCRRIGSDIAFDGRITPIRFRTTVLTDIYDQTKDIKQAQAAAGHTSATMTLKHYVKGRMGESDAASSIAKAYGII